MEQINGIYEMREYLFEAITHMVATSGFQNKNYIVRNGPSVTEYFNYE